MQHLQLPIVLSVALVAAYGVMVHHSTRRNLRTKRPAPPIVRMPFFLCLFDSFSHAFRVDSLLLFFSLELLGSSFLTRLSRFLLRWKQTSALIIIIIMNHDDYHHDFGQRFCSKYFSLGRTFVWLRSVELRLENVALTNTFCHFPRCGICD